MTQTVPIASAMDILGMVDLSGISAKTTKAKPTHPVYPDTIGEGAVMAARIRKRTEELEALSGALETDKACLKQLLTPFYFQQNEGRVEPENTFIVQSPEGEVTVTFKNAYPKLDPKVLPTVAPAFGANLAQCVRQVFKLEIDGDQLPAAKVPQIIAELRALFEKHACLGALSVSQGIKQVSDFHTKRHTLFTVEQNMALEQAFPIQSAISTKGRGGKKG